MKNPFDIYLRRYPEGIDIFNLPEEMLAAGVKISTLEKVKESGSGFLKVDLNRKMAQKVQGALRVHLGEDVEIRAVKYRDRKEIPYAVAMKVAENHLQSRKLEEKNSKEIWVGDVFLFSQTDVNWCFAITSPSLIEKGVAPGVLTACVDKVDGHIWTDHEFNYYEFLNHEEQILEYARKRSAVFCVRRGG